MRRSRRGGLPRVPALLLGVLVSAGALAGGNGAAAASAPAPAIRPGHQTTVTYCNGQEAQITEPPARHGPAPAVVYVHGGGWVSGDLHSGGFLIGTIGPALAARGFVVASVDYRLGPRAQWPDQIEDVTCAVRYLRAHARRLGVDTGAIGAWGVSAGGHLVSLLATARPSAGWDVGPMPGVSSRIEAVVDLSGPSDLLTMGTQGDAALVVKEFRSLLGSVPGGDLDGALRAASPVTYVQHGDPPFLVVQSTDDTVVPPQQALELDWDLAANAVPHRLVLVRGGGHALDDPGASPNEAQITALVVRYFVQTLVHHSVAGLADGSVTP